MGIIGVTCGEALPPAYLEYIKWQGFAYRVLTPSGTDGLEGLDALLLTGGGDMSERYGDYSHKAPLRGVSEQRDRRELELFNCALVLGLPVYGICRGLQVINCALGGSLYADIESCAGITERHCGEEDVLHGVELVPKTRLAAQCGGTTEVNSSHHQAIDRLGSGLIVSARSPGGVIEAVEHRILPILAVQWHPERLAFQKSGKPLF